VPYDLFPRLDYAAQLLHDGESGARLDHVASVLIFDHDAALRRVAGAAAAVNQEARAAAHVVRGIGVERVAVGHALKGLHVAQRVATLRKRSDTDLAL
jgi:hypothetical protein